MYSIPIRDDNQPMSLESWHDTQEREMQESMRLSRRRQRVGRHVGSDDGGSSVRLPQTHVEAVTKLAQMFETGATDLDLAIMQVIAGGGSASEWIAGFDLESSDFFVSSGRAAEDAATTADAVAVNLSSYPMRNESIR